MKGKTIRLTEMLRNRIEQDLLDELQHDIRPEVYWNKKKNLLKEERDFNNLISKSK